MANKEHDMADTAQAREQCAILDTGVAYYNNLVSELKNAKTKIQSNWEGDAAAIHDVITKIDQVTTIYESKIIPSMSGLSASIIEMADEIDRHQGNEIDNEGSTIPNQTPNSGDNGGSRPNIGAGIGAGAASGAALGAGIGAAVGSVVPIVGTGLGAGIGAAVGGVGGAITGGLSSAASGSSSILEGEFWSEHGENFAEAWTSQDWASDWDYSECDGLLDYVGATFDGVVGSVGNVVGGLVDTVGAGVNFVVDFVDELLPWSWFD